MESLVHDLRFTFRTLRLSPVFTSVAVLSLALGIGANSTLFSFYSAVFLQPLPVESPGELVNLYTSGRELSYYAPTSYADYSDLMERTGDMFSGVTAYRMCDLILDLGNRSERLTGESVSGDYFSVLGVGVGAGRAFSHDPDDLPGAEPTVVLSHNTWRSLFNREPGLISSSIRLEGTSFTVIGIAPESFNGMTPLKTDFWITHRAEMGLDPERADPQRQRVVQDLYLTGRLQTGVDIEKAGDIVLAVSEQLASEYPETNGGRRMLCLPTTRVRIDPELDGRIRTYGLVFLALSGIALLIACTNLANLLLARSCARHSEIALRLAMGARRVRLLRMLLTDSVLLGVSGGAVGLLVAHLLIRIILVIQPSIPAPVRLDIHLDRYVLLYQLALSVVTGVFIGFVPALQGIKADLMQALRNVSAFTSMKGRPSLLRNALIGIQVGLSAFLLVCGGLFVRSLARIALVDPGFDMRKGIITTLELPASRYNEESGLELLDELVTRAASIPGVEGAAIASRIPLSMEVTAGSVFSEPHGPDGEQTQVLADNARVGCGYFEVLGIRILTGRTFRTTDRGGSTRVVIINQALATRMWPGENPVGRQMRAHGEHAPSSRVIGVVDNCKYRSLGETDRPFIYLPISQSYTPTVRLAVRTPEDSGELINVLRNLIRDLDAGIPIIGTETLSEHMELTLFLPRLMAALLFGLGLLVLGLAVIGIYGVAAFTVARQTREVGIRIALGARRSHIIRSILLKKLTVIGIGEIAGLGIAFAATPSLRSLIFGIATSDPSTYFGIAVLLTAVALVAVYLPARRASRLDPVTALRFE